LQYQ